MYEYFLSLLNTKGVSTSDVAKETGISKSTFSEWKKGTYKPNGNKIYLISKYFNVPMENFYTTQE